MEFITELVTTQELIQRYKISRPKLYEWMEAGMPKYRIGRSYRFDVKQVDDWFIKYNAELDKRKVEES